MSLFKILRGSSSRIDTATTPFHDGYAYFTPDDGGFYIDAEDSGEQKRIRINPANGGGDPTLIVTTVLSASNWSGTGRQTVAISGLGADQNGIVGISQNITDEQFNTLAEANLYVESQSEGEITIAATGSVPTCDIPIAVMMFPGSDSSGTSIESGVSSFNGRVGAVLPQEGDYTAEMVGAQAIINGAASSITSSNLATGRALVSNAAGKVIASDITATELGYLDGVTSNIQTQISNHTGNNTTHITSSERTAWNAKANKPTKVTINLSTSWSGSSSPYTQTVSVSGGTSSSKVDLQPDATAFAHMVSVGCNALFVVNNNGTFTAYAIGAKTTTALSIQATVTEVS